MKKITMEPWLQYFIFVWIQKVLSLEYHLFKRPLNLIISLLVWLELMFFVK